MEKYEKIEVVDPVSVTSIADDDKRMPDILMDSKIILLMGTTGSGKSSFIECLGNNKSLGIAKNQLDGVTQCITLYEVTNIRNLDSPAERFFIMDTPGFADRSFPETKTLRMVQRWMEKYHCLVDRILYLDRITDPRMGGTKGKLLDLLKEITGDDTGNRITIVTTMWDQLWKDEQITRANVRLDQMSNVYYKAFVQDGAQVVKFENTHQSACNVIDKCLARDTNNMFLMEHMADDREKMANMSFGRSLHINLLERRSALLQQLRTLEDDLNLQLTQSDSELVYSLSKQRSEAIDDLTVVEEELQEFPDVYPEQQSSAALTTSKDDHAPDPSEKSARLQTTHEWSRFKRFIDRKKRQVKDFIRHRK